MMLLTGLSIKAIVIIIRWLTVDVEPHPSPEAVDSYRHALDFDPTYAWAWNGCGLAHAALNQWSDALDCYQQAVKYNTGDVWFWHNCGEAWMALENYERAIEDFQTALSLDRTHEPTRRKLQQAKDLLQTEE